MNEGDFSRDAFMTLPVSEIVVLMFTMFEIVLLRDTTSNRSHSPINVSLTESKT